MIAKRIAIDLGTANSVVYLSGKGVVLNEPTVVAVSTDDDSVIAVGDAARDMLGKTPENIRAMRPLKNGVIADYLVTEAMLRYFIGKVMGRYRLVRPDVVISIPAGATSVESRAVIEAAYAAGAKKAFLIPEPLAAAIGANLPIDEPNGNMIVNIGGGTTEIGIVSLYGMVVHGSVRVGGNTFDEIISSHIRRKYGLIIGENTSEAVKIKIGSAKVLIKELSSEVKGRDSISGFPRTITITSTEIAGAIASSLDKIARAVKDVLEKTPPELASDIIDKGIVISGGSSQLRKLDKYLSDYVGVPVHMADDPIFCVVRGLAIVLDNLELFNRSMIER